MSFYAPAATSATPPTPPTPPTPAEIRARTLLQLVSENSGAAATQQTLLSRPDLFNCSDVPTLHGVRSALVHFLKHSTDGTIDVGYVLQEIIGAWKSRAARDSLRLMVAADSMKFAVRRGGASAAGGSPPPRDSRIYERLLVFGVGTPSELSHWRLLFQALTYGTVIDRQLRAYNAWFMRVLLVLLRELVAQGRAEVDEGVLSSILRAPMWAFSVFVSAAFPVPPLA